MNYTEFKQSYAETDLKSLLAKYDLTQTELSELVEIPLRTIQNWCGGVRKPNDYIVKMIAYLLSQEENKMKKTRFEVESDVSMIMEDVRDDYRLPDCFYGDCYPQEVLDLETRLAHAVAHDDQQEYDELLDEVKDIFLACVPEEVELEGKHWEELTEDEQESLLEVANIDPDNIDKKTGECTIDFEVLSIAAKINLNSDEANDFEINDNSVLYNSRR